MKDLEKLAKYIDSAAFDSRSVTQLSDKEQIDLEESYQIQKLSIDHRISRGEKLLGYKMGFTSKAKMEQMGVHDLIWGRLTSSMKIENGKDIDLTNFIHPRAEPEIAFSISEDIDRALELDELKDVVDFVAPAIEVIDSRYENFKFTLEDVIADNCSSAAFVLGNWQVKTTPIEDLKMSITCNGELKHQGSSKQILDNPWNSLKEATRLITNFGETIKAGQIVLAGAATPAIYLDKNQVVKISVEGFDDVNLKIN